MGIIKAGYNRFGFQSIISANSVTGARIGDKAFETTRGVKRIFDGDNWLKEHAVSLTHNISETLLANGNTVTFTSTDNEIRTTESGDVESVIGTVIYKKGDTIGDRLPIEYMGDVLIGIDGTSTAPSGDLRVSSTTGIATSAGSGVGTFGYWTSSTASNATGYAYFSGSIEHS